MSAPQIGLLEGIPDEDPHNSSNLPMRKIELGNFLYTMALATTLEGSQKILPRGTGADIKGSQKMSRAGRVREGREKGGTNLYQKGWILGGPTIENLAPVYYMPCIFCKIDLSQQMQRTGANMRAKVDPKLCQKASLGALWRAFGGGRSFIYFRSPEGPLLWRSWAAPGAAYAAWGSVLSKCAQDPWLYLYRRFYIFMLGSLGLFRAILKGGLVKGGLVI